MPVTPDDPLAPSGFDVRVESGPNGLSRLAPHCAAIVTEVVPLLDGEAFVDALR